MHETLNRQDVLVDPSGQVEIVLWQDQVDSLSEGETYVFKNLRVKDSQYKERYVNPPKVVANFHLHKLMVMKKKCLNWRLFSIQQ